MYLNKYFSKKELLMWGISLFVIIVSFILFDRTSYITLLSSLIGVTSLIFAAKGNPVGMLLMIIFSFIYGAISYSFRYYGETLTYVGMTMPMSLISLIMWLKHPYKGKRSQVEVGKLSGLKVSIMLLFTVAVTIIFYFILRFFDTINLIFSTLSVTTSFLAVYFTALRSPYYALAYAFNDIILIILWTLAAFENVKFISVIICFGAFLMWDLYGFYSWKQMYKKQNK